MSFSRIVDASLGIGYLEICHIAILHDVVSTCHDNLALFTSFCPSTQTDKVAIGEYLSLNKSLDEIGMDNSRSIYGCIRQIRTSLLTNIN